MADELGVTHETIRKDLLTLESLSFEPTISARTGMPAEKQRIAAAAREFLPPTRAVLIDSGTTTEAPATDLPPAVSLVAITNALLIALALMTHPRLTVHLLGGRICAATMSTVDSWALRNLHDVQAEVAFLGANALSVEHADAVFEYADLDAIDIVTTDEGMSAHDAHALQAAAGVEVLRV